MWSIIEDFEANLAHHQRDGSLLPEGVDAKAAEVANLVAEVRLVRHRELARPHFGHHLDGQALDVVCSQNLRVNPLEAAVDPQRRAPVCLQVNVRGLAAHGLLEQVRQFHTTTSTTSIGRAAQRLTDSGGEVRYRALEMHPELPIEIMDGASGSARNDRAERATTMGLRRVRVIHVKVAAAIGLAAVLGMATLAAASPERPTISGPTEQAVSDPAQVDPAPTDPAADVTDGSDSAAEPPADDPAAGDPAPPDGTDTETPPAVAPGACLNHGQRVSAIAHSTPPGPGHGAAVSAAAHDHTGECAHTDGTDDPAADTGDVTAPPAESPVPAPSVAPAQHGPRHNAGGQSGSGKSHGHNKG
jgi:hypothetical protein